MTGRGNEDRSGPGVAAAEADGQCPRAVRLWRATAKNDRFGSQRYGDAGSAWSRLITFTTEKGRALLASVCVTVSP